MSGLEILGIAASIIQIADVGVNVSVKLCTFIHQVKNVNESAQSLSNDVALTSSVLRHLGENLQQDEQARLCSMQALALAQNVLCECGKVFDQINAAIEQPVQNDVKSRLLRSVRKVGLVLSERDMDALRSNLDRLKSTMLLCLMLLCMRSSSGVERILSLYRTNGAWYKLSQRSRPVTDKLARFYARNHPHSKTIPSRQQLQARISPPHQLFQTIYRTSFKHIIS